MEEERIKKPPSRIRIRTLKSDVEEMRQAGGKTGSGIIFGKKLEEIREEEKEEEKVEEKRPLFETKDEVEQAKEKKSKILPIIITIIIIFILGGASAFFLLQKLDGIEEPTPTIAPSPIYSSLFQFPPEKKEFVQFSGKITDFERILSSEFKNNFEPGQVKEIIFLKNEIDSFSANDFLRSIFSNFPGINTADIPSFENDFSFIIHNIEQEIINYTGYVLKIDTSQLPSFAISNLKSRFSTEFEKLIEGQPDLLTSQYLQDVGKSSTPFISKEIGPIKARFIKFSTGLEFYYGWYQDDLIISNNQQTFSKILEFLLPQI